MTTLLTRGAEGMDRRGFSIDEIEAMQHAGILDPDEKFELIDGEIVPMNAQNMPHMLWKAALNRWLVPRLLSSVIMIPEGTLTIAERPMTAFEPDFLIFAPEKGARRITPAMTRLAIEIADTSRHRDLDIKGPRYGKAGALELWVIDLQADESILHRGPTALDWADIAAVPFTQTIAPLFAPALALTLSDIAP
jgi:Uma2 family endonuclease